MYVTSHLACLSLLPSVGRQNEYKPNGGDTLRLGSKGRYGLCAGKSVLPYLSALENALVFKGALQMSRFTYLLTYVIPSHHAKQTQQWS